MIEKVKWEIERIHNGFILTEKEYNRGSSGNWKKGIVDNKFLIKKECKRVYTSEQLGDLINELIQHLSFDAEPVLYKSVVDIPIPVIPVAQLSKTREGM
jgi:hypothetical protein